jgi:hypothetical protein
MVKFAAARPPADACDGAMRSMREFVEATAPREGDADAGRDSGNAGAASTATATASSAGGRP